MLYSDMGVILLTKRLDLKGQVFGHFTALRPTKPGTVAGWMCLCVCGKEMFVTTSHLKSGARKSCGCEAWKDKTLLNKRFGKLIVSERLEPGQRKNGDGFSRWRCICDCGGEKITESQNLTKGKTTHCGCVKRPSRLRGEYGVSTRKRILDTYKRNAQNRNYDWEISDEEAFELFSGNCILCGNAPSTVARRDRLYGEFTYNGIDRIDNNLGYVKGNVQSCCKTCNIGKGTLSCEEWIEHCNRVTNHNS